MKRNVFTVPAGQPFLDCLARAILSGNLPAAGGTPPRVIDIVDYTLLLPTRRASRALADAFLRVGGGRAMLLPQIRPIAEGDEELSLLAGLADLVAPGRGGADVPAAMGELERRLTLTSLILRWSEAMRGAGNDAAAGASTPAQAATLAAELSRLMDMTETEEVRLDRLAGLVPEQFSEHWQQTLTFLTIITEAWPAHLAERGLISPAERRNRLLHAEALRLAAAPPKGPVIVAGVTGSIPATVALMRVVRELPHGAVVLPALDTDLDEESWGTIVPGHAEHPQFGLKKLLDGLGIARRDVAVLAGSECESGTRARARLVSETMRPSGSTGRWQTFANSARGEARAALSGLSLIEAPTAQDEAEAIALILREAAETPGRTAALVSPDRLLARRVAVRLEAWGIKVDDSAGRPFAKTVPGAFLDLTINAIAKRFAPRELMALLKHPLCRLSLDPFAVRRAARALEVAVFRAPYLGAGLDGVEAALERAARNTAGGEGGQRMHRAARRLWSEDWAGARDLVARLKSAFAPLVAEYARKGESTLSALAKAHAATAEALAAIPEGDAEPDGKPTSPLWQSEAGEAASRIFAGLLDASLPPLAVTATDYADLYRSLIARETVRPRGPVHPRLFIWGPFEARLQQPDVVVLGSLNDGTWPDAADPGPWLNRPMRAELGLPSPEERLGQAAHDFATLMGAPTVILTRAEKKDGVPTVPSRWLLRLKALLAGMGAEGALKPETPWLGWARLRHEVKTRAPALRPLPRPAVALRPRKLSVSRIEAWIANPYAIFAREILGLEALEPLGKEPGPALRGSIIHEALSRFSRDFPGALPDDAQEALVGYARKILDELGAHPRIQAFWVPRFERFATWFAETEAGRRVGVTKIVAETSGQLVLDAPLGPFTLTARADRIDVTAQGLVITDYKTGGLPKDNEVRDLVRPQLPLEAAIALAKAVGGGFAEVPEGQVATLRLIRAAGGEPAGEAHDVDAGDVAALAAKALDGLSRHVARFDDVATPYAALRRSRFSYDYDEYAHLARVAEWSVVAPDGEEAAA